MYVIRFNGDEPKPTYLVHYTPEDRSAKGSPAQYRTEGIPTLARKFSAPADAECLIESMNHMIREVMAPEVVPFQHAPEDCAGVGRIQSI